MTSQPHSEPSGIYIHLPFCRRQCTYCTFDTCPDTLKLPDYLDALDLELCRLPSSVSSVASDTLYFGGGSPSLLQPRQLNRLLQRIRERLPLAPGAEITLEANPEDVSPEKAHAWQAAGVNRISLGVQSIHPATLAMLSRPGGPRLVSRAVDLLHRAGFSNLGLDLILGLPGETSSHVRQSLDFVLSRQPTHLSLYLLEVHDSTPLGRQIRTGQLQLPDPDVVADIYLESVERLTALGWQHYEISNFCRPGYASRHNLKYWTLSPVFAAGSGAHGFDGVRRFWNESDIDEYEATLRAGRSPRFFDEGQQSDRELEFVYMGLRLSRGIDTEVFRSRFGRPFPESWRAILQKYVEPNLVIEDNTTLRLSVRGMLVSNEILQELIDAPDPE